MKLLEWKLLQWMAKPYGPNNDAFPIVSLSAKGRYFTHPVTLTQTAAKCVHKLIAAGYVDNKGTEYRKYMINEAGRAAALEIPKPEWVPPVPRMLTDEDIDVLRCLSLTDWREPLDCGGTSRNDVSLRLFTLCAHGLAAMRQRRYGNSDGVTGPAVYPEPRLTQRAKGSRQFKLTPLGADWIKK